MMRLPKSLRRDERGAAIVELAMVAPVIAILTVGLVDISNAFGRKLKIEQGAQRAIEKIMNTSASDTIENTLAAEAALQAEVPIGQVTVEYRLECNGALTAGEDCPSGQQAAKWISVSISDRYDPIFSRTFGAINGDGTYHLTAKAGVRIQ